MPARSPAPAGKPVEEAWRKLDSRISHKAPRKSETTVPRRSSAPSTKLRPRDMAGCELALRRLNIELKLGAKGAGGLCSLEIEPVVTTHIHYRFSIEVHI